MRRTWLTVCLLALIATGTQAQDFASRYMAEHEGDSLLHCISVSPKMMEKVMDILADPDENEDEEVQEYLLSKLRSARIITADRHAEKLFRKAEELMEKGGIGEEDARALIMAARARWTEE